MNKDGIKNEADMASFFVIKQTLTQRRKGAKAQGRRDFLEAVHYAVNAVFDEFLAEIDDQTQLQASQT